MLILHDYLQRLAGALLGGKGRGQAFEGGLALIYPVGLIPQVTGGCPVGGAYFERGLAVITQPEAGVFKGQGIHIDCAVAFVGEGSEGVLVKTEQVGQVVIRDGASEPDVGEVIPAGSDCYHIIGLIGAESELTCALITEYGHRNISFYFC